MKRTELDELIELRRLLRMADGAFIASFPFGEIRRFDGTKISSTDFIVEHTRLWRETWILPVLDRLIAKREAQQRKRRKRTAFHAR